MTRDDLPPIGQRKAEHIEVAASGAGDFRATRTLLDEVRLVHQALPELAVEGVDLATVFVGKPLRLPFLITGMTGGTPGAGPINRALACAAEAEGVAFGVGSQRAMWQHPETFASYAVRDVAPTVVLLGNIGVMQAKAMGVTAVRELATRLGADAMAVHLNPAQELAQVGGDRDFRGAVDVIARLVNELGLPVVVKETGCGLSREAAAALVAAGVAWVDVAGAGGTSWVAVEAERSPTASVEASIGQAFREWGVPTAVSVVACATAGLRPIASGGIRGSLDAAHAFALGAQLVGAAAPFLRAQRTGGVDAIRAELRAMADVLRTACVLTGVATPAGLARVPRHLGPNLRDWLLDLGLPVRP